MDSKDFLQSLGIGLSRVLRYSFGGFLLIVVIAFAETTKAQAVVEAIGWELTSLCALIIGTGVYAVHRSLVIPLHHLFGIGLLNLGELISNRPKNGKRSSDAENRTDSRIDSLSPTHWLAYLGVPKFRRMIAYARLRRDFFDEKERTSLDVVHAESGLSVMVSEAFLGASAYFYMAKQSERLDLLAVGVGLFVLSAASGIQQHRVECGRFKEDRRKVMQLIEPFCFNKPQGHGA